MYIAKEVDQKHTEDSKGTDECGLIDFGKDSQRVGNSDALVGPTCASLAGRPYSFQAVGFSGLYEQNVPVRMAFEKCRPRSGCSFWILARLSRMRPVTALRIRSVESAAFFARPPRPKAED